MAHMTKEHKARIAAELKKFMPKNWKYSLAIRHHAEIVMTIQSAPIDILAAAGKPDAKEMSLTRYFRASELFKSNPELAELFQKIRDALDLDNHDRSDLMTDYFDVGHYLTINIGKWNKPFTLAA
ncbi:hypothetical protein [Acidithiobacillus thiooxidans]|uniref:hypothetical protein n=1 Tax=Acidithiobacillus thiooxidans TaxID=930 RepID=UPI001C06AC75|nr:hypothetical protein [Acidithiobacillus thiooxidans]MBU2843545.1 hypothetical protein [Acidithiobacillus thiooxidans]